MILRSKSKITTYLSLQAKFEVASVKKGFVTNLLEVLIPLAYAAP